MLRGTLQRYSEFNLIKPDKQEISFLFKKETINFIVVLEGGTTQFPVNIQSEYGVISHKFNFLFTKHLMLISLQLERDNFPTINYEVPAFCHCQLNEISCYIASAIKYFFLFKRPLSIHSFQCKLKVTSLQHLLLLLGIRGSKSLPKPQKVSHIFIKFFHFLLFSTSAIFFQGILFVFAGKVFNLKI